MKEAQEKKLAKLEADINKAEAFILEYDNKEARQKVEGNKNAKLELELAIKVTAPAMPWPEARIH